MKIDGDLITFILLHIIMILFAYIRRRTVTRSEMTQCDPKQYDGPRTMAESCVQRLFEYIVWPVDVVKHGAVQLNPNANRGDDKSPGVDDTL